MKMARIGLVINTDGHSLTVFQFRRERAVSAEKLLPSYGVRSTIGLPCLHRISSSAKSLTVQMEKPHVTNTRSDKHKFRDVDSLLRIASS